MKNKKIYNVFTIVSIVVSFSLLAVRIHKDYVTISRLEFKINEFNGQTAYDIVTQLTMQDISLNDSVFDSLPINHHIVVFPDDFCDVCNRAFLWQLSENENKENVTLIIPPRMKKMMAALMFEYNIRDYNIIYRNTTNLRKLSNGILDNSIYIFHTDSEGNGYHPLMVNIHFNLYAYIAFHEIND